MPDPDNLHFRILRKLVYSPSNIVLCPPPGAIIRSEEGTETLTFLRPWHRLTTTARSETTEGTDSQAPTRCPHHDPHVALGCPLPVPFPTTYLPPFLPRPPPHPETQEPVETCQLASALSLEVPFILYSDSISLLRGLSPCNPGSVMLSKAIIY